MTTLDVANVFLVDWYDSVATLTKQYLLTFYEKDNSVEMYDQKNRRFFLKRSPVENISASDFFIGNSINILSRQLKIVAYGDTQTEKRVGARSEKTFVIVKPDAYCKIGQILTMFYKCGLQIVRLKTFGLTRLDSADFYSQYKGGNDDRSAIDHLASGTIAVIELIGENVLSKVVAIAGPNEPSVARSQNPASIRAKFGTDRTANAVETVDSREANDSIGDFFFGGRSQNLNNSVLFDNSTCVLIKPHAISEEKAGSIITRIAECGFELSAIGLFKLDKVNVEEFLEVYRGVVPEYPQMVVELASGPCIAIEARGQDAVQKMRQLCGPHDPEVGRQIRPNSLRAMFGHNKHLNAVHCTDLPEDAMLELEYFFKILD